MRILDPDPNKKQYSSTTLVILKDLKIVGSGIGQLQKMFEWYWTTPKNVRSGIGQLRKRFRVGPVLDNSENFWEWYWTIRKFVQSCPIPLWKINGDCYKFFGVVLDNSEKCSEWYWTTPNNCSELSNTTSNNFVVEYLHEFEFFFENISALQSGP